MIRSSYVRLQLYGIKRLREDNNAKDTWQIFLIQMALHACITEVHKPVDELCNPSKRMRPWEYLTELQDRQPFETTFIPDTKISDPFFTRNFGSKSRPTLRTLLEPGKNGDVKISREIDMW